MKAIAQLGLGEPAEVLRPITIDDAVAVGDDDVVVDVTLSPIHFGDLFLVRSQSEISETNMPLRRGSEAVGVVRALGSNLSSAATVAIGDRVIGFPASGAWADSVVVRSAAVVPVPPDITDQIAAQLLINFITAKMVIRGLRKSVSRDTLQRGAVLVTGASTVVGSIILHLMREEKILAVGLVRSEESADRIRSTLGDISVTATSERDWLSSVSSKVGRRDIVGVLDCVSGQILEDISPVLADDAAIVTYGALSGKKLAFDTLQVTSRQFIIRGVVFTRWFSELSAEERANDLESAFAVARAFPSLFRTSDVYGLDDIRAAVVAVERPGRNGFVFLRPDRPMDQ